MSRIRSRTSAWWVFVACLTVCLPACGVDVTVSDIRALDFRLTSAAFDADGPIPTEHTGEGADVSPHLAWTNVPAGTKQLALVCDDPDAPRAKPWVHWVLYGLASDLGGLGKGANGGGREGVNDFGRPGWGGPMPPSGHGIHHYHFVLYALDRDLDLPEGLTKEQLLDGIEGHVLERAELVGTYERK